MARVRARTKLNRRKFLAGMALAGAASTPLPADAANPNAAAPAARAGRTAAVCAAPHSSNCRRGNGYATNVGASRRLAQFRFHG